ncbi:MAG: peptidoglycan DD-metalloendopeptidase family protein [Thiovulaceae bacterium]|nr:peptidoglycan DD-metalloendopeptidase family protein [Sulfurimonadaceae bacterium]
MRFIVVFFFLISLALSANLDIRTWKSGFTFLNFLEANNLPLKTYYNLDKEDQKATEEILAGIEYEILLDEKKNLLQALIPINESIQLHIYQDAKKDYHLKVTPILLDKKREAFTFTLRTSPYNDIMHYTKNRFLAQEFVWAYKNSLNFKTSLRKNDRIVIIYDQLYRNGRHFGYPDIQVAMVNVYGKPRYIYRNTDGRYYDAKGKETEGFKLAKPIKNGRITSRYSKRRWHPVLKRYRVHQGVDFGARSGTPILAAAKGRVSFAGQTRGYGNIIKILHRDGYQTLYAHMKSFKGGMKRGKRVKKGSIIGYVGSTGLSTGPHLHFGLYHNGRPRNPAGVIRITTNVLRGKKRKAFKILQSNYNQEVALHIKANTKPNLQLKSENVCYLGANNPVNNISREK